MIRQALSTDAPEIAKLIILAMGNLSAKFTGSSDPEEAIVLFERFAGLTNNQYSYENILVYEDEEGVCGMISAYDGANLSTLRTPFLTYLEETYAFKYDPEDETEQGEYYIDCVSVSSRKQGKGIGKVLIKALIDHAVEQGHFTVGLIVNKENIQAEKLYTSLGFKVVKERDFMEGKYFHMQHAIVK